MIMVSDFHYQDILMYRDRKILLRILLLTLLIPIILFIGWNLNGIKSSRNRISQLENTCSLSDLQTEYIKLSKEFEYAENRYNEIVTSLFYEDNIKFYEFCNLIIDAAENRRVIVNNYNTNESTDPERINISVEGKINEILEYLQFLYEYQKKIDIAQMSLGYNSEKNNYSLALMINFIISDSFTGRK